MLDFTEVQERLRDEYERKRQPLIEQIRDYQKKIENLETDGSREDRWFACEALVDSVNALLQRKTLQLH
jgi:phage terminase large subunit-like protein